MIARIYHQHALRKLEIGHLEMGDVQYLDNGDVLITNWRPKNDAELQMTGAEIHEIDSGLKFDALIYHPSRKVLPHSEPLKVQSVSAEQPR